jgi:hypothetical protein
MRKLLGVAMLSAIAIGMSLIPQVFEAFVADPSAVANCNALFDQVRADMTFKLDATKAGVTQEIEQSRTYFFASLSEFNNKTATLHDEFSSLLLSLHELSLSVWCGVMLTEIVLNTVYLNLRLPLLPALVHASEL